MLLLLLLHCLFASLAMSQKDCRMSSPQVSLPSCMDVCFQEGGCSGADCPCPQNLRGWCEMSGGEGPDSWFAHWGMCVVKNCPNDGDITNLMLLYIAQCDGTVGGPLNNDTVPYPLRDWVPKPAPRSTSVGFSMTSSSAFRTAAISVSVFITSGSQATSFETSTSPTAASRTPSAEPANQEDSKPMLSVAAIIGVVVGGTVLLALIVGLVVYYLRYRERKKLPSLAVPPRHDGSDSKDGYHKAELDGQGLAYEPSKLVYADTPTEYAELDGDRPVNPDGGLANGSQTCARGERPVSSVD